MGDLWSVDCDDEDGLNWMWSNKYIGLTWPLIRLKINDISTTLRSLVAKASNCMRTG